MSLLSSHVTNHPVIRLAPSLTQSVTARVTGLMPLFDRAIAKSQTEGESERGRGLAETDFDLPNCV